LIDALFSLASDGERLNAIRSRLKTKFRPEAWNSDWSATRRIIAGQGRSLLRMFSSQYRLAVADLRGAWMGDLPKDHQSRVKASTTLVDGARLSGLIASAGTSLGASLGTLWKGEVTNWDLLRLALAWLRESQRFDSSVSLRRPERLIEVELAKDWELTLQTPLSQTNAALSALAKAVALDEAIALDGIRRKDITVAAVARFGAPLAQQVLGHRSMAADSGRPRVVARELAVIPGASGL